MIQMDKNSKQKQQLTQAQKDNIKKVLLAKEKAVLNSSLIKK
jgi:hypothetical protein